MMLIKALHLEDFGPFKGRQSLSFSREDGVTVIYGENMRGKTSLLNAVRFALFGKVIGRGTKPLALHKIGNWEQAAIGKYGFEVQLEFSNGAEHYKLTRSCRVRNTVRVPTEDADYAVTQYLEKNGHVMGPQQAEAELKGILPEQISRFFLFDGELLQEYEDLLSSDTDMGRRISDAIERILGVPVLTSARATLTRAKERSELREATAAQGDQKTREFGIQLGELHAQRNVHNSDLIRLRSELEAMRSHKSTLEDLMKKKERFAALLEKRDALDRLLKEIDARRTQKQKDLQDAMSGAWCSLIAEPMKEALTGLRSSERSLQIDTMRADVLRDLQADANSDCPACLQKISAEARARIASGRQIDGAEQRLERSKSLTSVQRKIGALEGFMSHARNDLLRVLWNAVEEASVDHSAKKGERDEIAKQLESVDEEALRKTKADYESTIRQIDAFEKGIEKILLALDQNRVNSEGIQRRLDKLAGGNLGSERVRREIFSDLHKLFDEAVAVYREQLRKRVEADASSHFISLTTEDEYAGLRINESYGLTILHRDGTDIPVRSAGAEHVVALSLMGALQNNAPLRGPIIIDSPFGRLDGGHTKNIVRALPNMTKQVVLLVYEEELPPDLVRSELMGKLRGEWRLERKSARHTDLVPRTD